MRDDGVFHAVLPPPKGNQKHHTEKMNDGTTEENKKWDGHRER